MLLTYAADLVVVSFAGLVMKGFADGSFVTIKSDDDDWKAVVGTDGQVTRSRTNNGMATIEILLMQSSASNDLLSTLRNLDINAPNGAGVGAFLVADLSGRARFRAAQAWIQKAPDVDLAREAGPRTWTLRAAKLLRTDGGN